MLHEGNRTGKVGVDRDVEVRFAQLGQHQGTKLGNVERRRSQRDQRSLPRLLKLLVPGPKNPLR